MHFPIDHALNYSISLWRRLITCNRMKFAIIKLIETEMRDIYDDYISIITVIILFYDNDFIRSAVTRSKQFFILFFLRATLYTYIRYI